MFEQGALEADPAKRAQIYAEVQKIISVDVPIAWLLELQFPTLYRRKLNNVINSAIGLNDSLARITIA